MILEPQTITDSINLILKDAREERRLFKQTLYTMFSAYTNNLANLAINPHSGEDKCYVLQKVEDFLKEQNYTEGASEKIKKCRESSQDHFRPTFEGVCINVIPELIQWVLE
jgi:hypothetical protein